MTRARGKVERQRAAEVQGAVVLERDQVPQPPVMGEGGGVGGAAVRGPLGRAGRASLGFTCEASPAELGVCHQARSDLQAHLPVDHELESAGRGLASKCLDGEGGSGLGLCDGIEAGKRG